MTSPWLQALTCHPLLHILPLLHYAWQDDQAHYTVVFPAGSELAEVIVEKLFPVYCRLTEFYKYSLESTLFSSHFPGKTVVWKYTCLVIRMNFWAEITDVGRVNLEIKISFGKITENVNANSPSQLFKIKQRSTRNVTKMRKIYPLTNHPCDCNFTALLSVLLPQFNLIGTFASQL